MTGPTSRSTPLLGPRYSIATAPEPVLTGTQLAARESILAADNSDDYERVRCLCGANSDAVLAQVERHGLPCTNVICLSCGLIRIDPRWNERRYREFYERDYRALYDRSGIPKDRYAVKLAGSASTIDRARWIVKIARQHLATGSVRIVELGAGGGWNLASLPAEWTRIGYDVDSEYLLLGAHRFALDMRTGLIDEALADVESADLVLLSHVVEHFSSPERELRKIAQRLGPEAILLIEVPGVYRLHRTNLDPMTYLQNAHPYTFTASSLAQVCARAGLEVVEIDQTVRAVSRATGQGDQGLRTIGSPTARNVIRYLRLCESGLGWYHRLRRMPVVGRLLAYWWRKSYFAGVGLLRPPSAM